MTKIETKQYLAFPRSCFSDSIQPPRYPLEIAFAKKIQSEEKDPFEIAKELNVLQEKNDDTLQSWIDEVLASMPEKVSEYKKGKKNLTGLFAGEVKKKSKGKADMQAVIKILSEKLNQ